MWAGPHKIWLEVLCLADHRDITRLEDDLHFPIETLAFERSQKLKSIST
jgi:hypothetical protein